MEVLRDQYPKSYILNFSVLPFDSGDSPLCCYNNLLNLSWIQNYSDGCMLLPNSELAIRVVSSKQCRMHYESTEFGGINNLISKLLHGILSPIDSYSTDSHFNGWNLLDTMTPLCKFFAGISSESVDNLLFWQNFEIKRCISAQLYLRGTSNLSIQRVRTRVEAALDFVQWNHECLDTVLGKRSSKSVPECTLLYNAATHIGPRIQRVISDAKCKLRSRAFLHWYQRDYEQDICSVMEDSLEGLQSIVDMYTDWSI